MGKAEGTGMVKHLGPTIANRHDHAWAWRLKGRMQFTWNPEKTDPRKSHEIQLQSLPVPAELDRGRNNSPDHSLYSSHWSDTKYYVTLPQGFFIILVIKSKNTNLFQGSK